MNVFLWGLVVIISILIFSMVILGLYYIIARIQVYSIYRVLDKLWDYCTLIYYYMDEELQEMVSERLKLEYQIEIDLDGFYAENDDENHTNMKRLIKSVPVLYQEYYDRFQSSCLLARNIAYGSDAEIKEVTEVFNSVLGVW